MGLRECLCCCFPSYSALPSSNESINKSADDEYVTIVHRCQPDMSKPPEHVVIKMKKADVISVGPNTHLAQSTQSAAEKRFNHGPVSKIEQPKPQTYHSFGFLSDDSDRE